MSTLVSIVGDDQEELTEWKLGKAKAHHPLNQFHAKFWGKEPDTMANSNDMEVANATADADDIGSGCYPLDIGVETMEGKIWVRSEYIRMFTFAEELYAENKSNLVLSPCLVITGQPGIGEFF
jgi:hypothetical protein